MLNLKPLKRFGQNYITDNNIVEKIVREFNPHKDDAVIEIGPGTGALTSFLAGSVKKLYGVEIDKRVIDDLQRRFPQIVFINKDFLKLDLSEIERQSKKIRIIGNIPYNITSPILFKLIENRTFVQDAMLMVQLEVAKRITAKEKSKDYGILGVILNYFAQTKLCFKISPNVFYPKPKVFSAIVHINFVEREPNDVDYNLFIQVVKAAFGNRRKTLKNSLGNSKFASIEIETEEFNLQRRAEELTIEDFVLLTKIIKSKLNLYAKL